VPVRIRRFRVNRASAEEAAWLRDMLDREGRAFGTSVRPGPDGTLLLHWDSQDAVG
jgi:poly-gamma-glutamate capsule biosynthesis protein CapA/YwtB (metallophosphatase superfamily)